MSTTTNTAASIQQQQQQGGDEGDGNNNNNKRQQPSSPDTTTTKRVIIVGAGAAAIQLAHTLWKESSSSNNCSFQVTILEANDYIGGRVCSSTFHGHTVERGANWISGREEQTHGFDTNEYVENPIWTLAKQIQLQGHVSQRDDSQRIHVVDTTTTGKNNNAMDEYLAQVTRFEDIYAKVVQGAVTAKGTTTIDDTSTLPPFIISPQSDVSVQSLLEQHGWPKPDKLNPLERIVQCNLLEVWVADSLNQLSAAHDLKPGANDMDLGHDEMFVEDERGFNSIFHSIVNDLKKSGTTQFLLNKQVQSIHYEPGQVKVVVKNIKPSNNDNDIGASEEEVYYADIVVSTVSLGVLQSGNIQFVPLLPDWKVAAFNEMQMFTFAKVFCKFRKRLWPKNKDYLIFISDKKQGYYPLWMKYKNVVAIKDDDDENLLFMCYLGGTEAQRVERLDEEQVKDEIEDLFSKAFFLDNDNNNIKKEDCRPVSVAVTDWSRNPRFCGSYSYYPVGAFGSIPKADYRCGLTGLAAHDVSSSNSSAQVSIEEEDGPKNARKEEAHTTLYFAGEAFDDKFNGWVQGAYLSGQRVARCILEDMQRQTKAAKQIKT